MTKRLSLVLAFAFVVGLAFTAYAEVQNVKVSGDLDAYGIARNQFGLSKDKTLKNETGAASITRVKVDADLTDNVSTTVRLLNERYWGTESVANTDIDLDLAFVSLKEFLYSPLTLKLGRQELHFGNDMIVGDVDTNRLVNAASPFSTHDEDLSARKAFDAVRATFDYNPLVIDLVAAKISEGVLNNNDDQNLYGINAKYDTGKNNTTLEGYLFSKAKAKKAAVAGLPNQDSKGDKVHAIGALVKSQPVENLTTSLEAAYQFGTFVDNIGRNDSARRRAWATEAGINYTNAKAKYTPSLTVLGAYFSGAKNPGIPGNEGRKEYTGWDVMFENQKYGDIANSLFAQSNAKLLGGIASIKPMEDVTLSGEYYAYWWDRKFQDGTTTLAAGNVRSDTYLMRNKRFAGQEIDLKAVYDYTEDVQFALLGGWLVPGKSFDKSNNNIASEVVGSMKVTF
jgi:hypothetical protein